MKRPNCPKCGRQMVRGPKAGSGKVRWSCGGSKTRPYCYSTTDPTGKERGRSGRRKKTPLFKRALGGVTRIVVTAAQNATPVNRGVLKSFETYCNHNNADLVVIPLRYKNPTSRWTASQANDEVWDSALTPYLCNQRKRLNKNLVLLGDVKTQPTAAQPLTGFDAITHGESCILGHTKLQLRTVAAPQSKFPKILTTTGACTAANYSDSKAGKLGEFHHVYGAALVELDDKTFHLRQLNCEASGGFTDLNKSYQPWGVEHAEPALALVMGDTHRDFIDSDVERATFGKNGMVEVLDPKVLVYHDLHDGYTVNPHHTGNPFNAIAKVQNDRADAKAEVMRALEFVRKYGRGRHSVIVPSNHDDFLTRWIVSQDWRTAPGNAEFYLETALAMVRGTKLGSGGTEYPSPFIYWGRKVLDGESVRFLDRDESYTLGGIELGMHGDKGPNGSRGSLMNLRNIGVKWISGHPHAPGILNGGMQVGTSTGKLEYCVGPSSWLQTHAVVYANGKRSLLNIIKGNWRL